MWKFDHRTKEKPQKLRASKEFKGLPRDLSAAFEDQEGEYYNNNNLKVAILPIVGCNFFFSITKKVNFYSRCL